VSKLRMAHLGIALVCTVFFSTLALAADKKSPTKLSDLPLEDQHDISAALARELPGLQNFTLTASDGANDDYFGASVAIDGNTVVVGASKPFNHLTGEAYVFVKTGGSWKNMTQTAVLTASDGAGGNDFGSAVAISGSTVVVGAPQASVNGNQAQGKAYVFVKPSTGWKNMTETAILLASDGGTASNFGIGVGISGDTVVVGAYSPTYNPGSAYVFVQPSGGWVNTTETAELTASDRMDNDEFGYSVSISGSTAIVGAPNQGDGIGSAYVFVEPPSGWVNMAETAELTASDRAISNFGWSVSLNGSTAVVGAPYDGRGAAYVFVEPLNGWSNMTETAKLSAPAGSEIGMSVALSEEAVITGAPFTNPAHQGSAYVFLKPTGGWKNTTKPNLALAIPFTYGFDNFGTGVGISGKTGVVGAASAPTSPPCNPKCKAGPGEAFVFVEQ
jgi:FG-GAP repeat